MITQLCLAALAGYLLGSVPFGLVFVRLWGLGDLRKVGSGNIGATNVLRTGHKTAAALTLLFDAGKGALAVILARQIFGEFPATIAGGAAFLGHCFPVYLWFRGGKGVATFLGTLIALLPIWGAMACIIWAAVAATTRISSLAALTTAAAAPLIAVVMGRMEIAAVSLVMSVVIFWRHKDNIDRIRCGTEPKIGNRH